MRSTWTRRQFCQTIPSWFATGYAWSMLPAEVFAAEAGVAENRFVVEQIERTTLKLPYRDIPRRAMDRELPHWRYTEVFRVMLKGGAVGLGETLLFYTWGATQDEDVQRAQGHNAIELMWDDSLGAGLQMALFDAVARQVGVPIHQLFGRQVHDRTPLSWWNIDMPPVDMASECRTAHAQGYHSYKTKGRPWFDLWQQIADVSEVVPESFKVDMDFNDTLLDADRAIPILTEFEENPRIDIYETPIPQQDVEGNRRITAATRVNIALHYGTPAPRVVVDQQVCDGFVIGGGARRVMQRGSFSDEVEMPFWLQLVGSDITAAFSLHFGAVLRQAVWPAVNCHQLYDASLLSEPIVVTDGTAAIPQKPGLGFDLNMEMVERFRVDKPPARPEPPRLIETTWPDGRRMDTANDGSVNFMLRAGMQERYPYYERGVQSQLVPNDGSAAWMKRYQTAREQGPRLISPAD